MAAGRNIDGRLLLLLLLLLLHTGGCMALLSSTGGWLLNSTPDIDAQLITERRNK
jgi:hypothetical protein